MSFKVAKPIFKKPQELPLDPYFLGLWLGDGKSNDVVIYSSDPEIEEYLEFFAQSMGLRLTSFKHDTGSVSSTDAARRLVARR